MEKLIKEINLSVDREKGVQNLLLIIDSQMNYIKKTPLEKVGVGYGELDIIITKDDDKKLTGEFIIHTPVQNFQEFVNSFVECIGILEKDELVISTGFKIYFSEITILLKRKEV